MSRNRGAFTLIELMVVITIIALLAGLTVWLVSIVQFNAKKLVTLQRMDAVTQGLSQLGSNEGSAAYLIQHQVTSQDPYVPHGTQANQSGWPHYEGVVTFDTSGYFNGVSPTITNPDPFPLINPAAVPPLNEGQWFMEVPPMTNYQTGYASLEYDDHLFNYPWGKTTVGAVPLGTVVGPQPEHHVLRNICPYQTMNLLKAASVLTDDPYTDASNSGRFIAGDPFIDISGAGTYQYASDLYTTDRHSREPWNDKWGNPLVVAYAIYQPPPSPTIPNGTPLGVIPPNIYVAPNILATQALKTYQYARSVYISVAAAGPYVRNITTAKLASPNLGDWIDTPPGGPPGAVVTQWQGSPVWDNSSYNTVIGGGNLYLIWKQANQICQQPQGTDPATQPELRCWNETSFDDPPWLGTKWGHRTVNGHNENCFLTAPQELK
jgi:prepilin-type N-terminal cleavage/methylation domain-containing protein